MHVLLAIHRLVAMNIWSEGGFRQRRSLSTTYFCPALDPPLWIFGQNHYQNGSVLSKAFCLWSSLWLLLALPWIHHRADLIKSLNTCAGHENFIPTKFHVRQMHCFILCYYTICPLVLYPPPSFKAMYCVICDHRRVERGCCSISDGLSSSLLESKD